MNPLRAAGKVAGTAREGIGVVTRKTLVAFPGERERRET